MQYFHASTIHKNSHHLHLFLASWTYRNIEGSVFFQASSVYTQVLRMSDYNVLTSSLAVNNFLVCCLLLRSFRFHVFFLFPSVSLCSTSSLTVPVFVYLSYSSLNFTWLSPKKKKKKKKPTKKNKKTKTVILVLIPFV